MNERPVPRVLIVDDQPDMARAMMRVFGDDVDVTMATSGEAALHAIAQSNGFDLVLCDVMMPGMTGPQLFRQVQAAHPQTATAFVFTTGGVTSDEEATLRATGVPCLLKPVDREALRGLLVARSAERRCFTPSSEGR